MGYEGALKMLLQKIRCLKGWRLLGSEEGNANVVNTCWSLKAVDSPSCLGTFSND